MNQMRKLLLPLAIVAIAAGPASMAMAATKPAAKAHAAAAANPKTADCEKQWKAEKKHSQTKKAFLAACEAKA
jgi:Ni/Co efflux regulator RcnB